MNIVCFTDGSYNPTKCGYSVYFPNKELSNISKLFTFGNPTNQRAELYAIYKAIKSTSKLNYNSLEIYTDSQYCINIFTKWISKWKLNNWKSNNKDILNQDIIIKIDKYMNNKIKFIHVYSHTNKQTFEAIGNDMADKLAKLC